MFCDLVGSTALSGKLDPEDLQRVIRSYHDAGDPGGCALRRACRTTPRRRRTGVLRLPDLENIEHTRTKAKSPQINGICERFQLQRRAHALGQVLLRQDAAADLHRERDACCSTVATSRSVRRSRQGLRRAVHCGMRRRDLLVYVPARRCWNAPAWNRSADRLAAVSSDVHRRPWALSTNPFWCNAIA